VDQQIIERISKTIRHKSLYSRDWNGFRSMDSKKYPSYLTTMYQLLFSCSTEWESMWWLWVTKWEERGSDDDFFLR